ncbi:MAG: hypothetical protein FJ096_13855 [Deltaproteobacteria bacterium]|nr:hypothetical protein [Deltaproteobacteria bacterium]
MNDRAVSASGALGHDGRRFPGIRGLFGRTHVDLSPFIDVSELPTLHEEICLALAQVPLDYTGGSHRSMGIMPEVRRGEAYGDYGEVIADLSAGDFEVLASLADDPSAFRAARGGEFGEERSVPLSRRQLRWLEVRHGVYFPWKGYVELMPNRYWSEKASPEGKRFTRVAEAYFAKTLAFVRRLPFESIGRCNVMGLAPLDHGTVHRDGEPDDQDSPDHFISFVPGMNKRLFLWDDVLGEEVPVEGPVYWFNDHDYHGVASAPVFRYSVRVDGTFRREFLDALAAAHPTPASP